MARMTKQQTHELRTILAHMERAEAYIKDESIAVARRELVATTTLHYTREDGSSLYEVEKSYGSDLCGLQTAIGQLSRFIIEHGFQPGR